MAEDADQTAIGVVDKRPDAWVFGGGGRKEGTEGRG